MNVYKNKLNFNDFGITTLNKFLFVGGFTQFVNVLLELTHQYNPQKLKSHKN